MRRRMVFFAMIAVFVISLSPAGSALAQEDYKDLAASWWQWATSIPTPVNPLLDQTGEACMVGQHGPVWFLAGTFNGGTMTRECSVPQGAVLFFPVFNAIWADSPNACQGPESIPIEELRSGVKDLVASAKNLAVEIDGQPLKKFQHVVSRPFTIALPEDNIWDEPCKPYFPEGNPAGVFYPAVDEGYYVKLRPLAPGEHTIHIHAEGSNDFFLDVTYYLTVVPR